MSQHLTAPPNMKHEVKPNPDAVEFLYHYAKSSAENEQAIIDGMKQERAEYNHWIIDGDRNLARIHRQAYVDRRAALDKLWKERNEPAFDSTEETA